MININKTKVFTAILLSAGMGVTASVHAASLNLKDLVNEREDITTTPEATQTTSEKGVFNINVKNADALFSSQFPLNIEITELKSKNKVNIIPGSYEYRPGDYNIRVYRSKKGSNKPYSGYQIIEDTITITNKGTVTRDYASPERREKVTSAYVVGFSLAYAVVPDSYTMSNPEKEHFDELNVSNNLSDTVEYGDTAYTAEAGTGYALSFAYMFPGKWMIEAETYSASDSNMTRSGTSFGAGMYTNTNDSLSWYSLGAGSETASWDGVSVTSGFGTTTANGSTDNSLFYVKWAKVHKSSGVTYSLKYDVSNAVITANIGWSLTGEKSYMPLPETSSHNE